VVCLATVVLGSRWEAPPPAAADQDGAGADGPGGHVAAGLADGSLVLLGVRAGAVLLRLRQAHAGALQCLSVASRAFLAEHSSATATASPAEWAAAGEEDGAAADSPQAGPTPLPAVEQASLSLWLLSSGEDGLAKVGT
jgi:hypothetical protein